ncbi:HNH endonuclease [Microbacterium sp. S1037]|uniref:HNH endonuclease n=1 Tax=Microbacterium sp. S1037 TaxID=3398227 RepID=UPI003AAFC93E
MGADLCADLLLTAAPTIDPTTEATCPGGLGAIRAQIQITVPVLTLLGHTDAGAAVAGRSPIDPESARHLAAHAPGWDRVLCDPVTGTVLEVDRYSPSAVQRRYLAARDQHCRAPGCRAPLTRCQLDHNHEAQHGGATTLTNLCHLCVRHHTLKTETAWSVTQEPDGTLHFRSPLGQRVTETPPPRIMFLPDSDGAGEGHTTGTSTPPDAAPF